MQVARGLAVILATAVIGGVSSNLRAQDGGALLVRFEGMFLPQNRVVAIVVDDSVMQPTHGSDRPARRIHAARGGRRTRHRACRR